jgi:Leucine-rich repeat (LRR) protein
MSYLKDTSYLDVSMNNIEGDIKESIGSNLVSLRLSSNNFVSIPDLSIFPALKNFDINSNKITGSIPEELASLNLVYLDLSTNYFDGTIPTIPGEMKSLESL